MSERRTYTRWTAIGEMGSALLSADWIGSKFGVSVHQAHEIVTLAMATPHTDLTPDEARMIGCRLLEAAALADVNSAIRYREHR